jgi:hypothetical protein
MSDTESLANTASVNTVFSYDSEESEEIAKKITNVTPADIKKIRETYLARNNNRNATITTWSSSEPEMRVAREKVIWYLEHKLKYKVAELKSASLYLYALEGKYIRNQLCESHKKPRCKRAIHAAMDHVSKFRDQLKLKFDRREENVTNKKPVDEFIGDYAPNLLYLVKVDIAKKLGRPPPPPPPQRPLRFTFDEEEVLSGGGKRSRKARRASRKGRRGSRKAKSSRKASRGSGGSRKH